MEVPEMADVPWVLVVEDERDTLMILCQILARRGVRHHGAKSPEEALALIDEHGLPGAASIDYLLDGRPAVDLLEVLRDADVPVVIVSDMAEHLQTLLRPDWHSVVRWHDKSNMHECVDAVIDLLETDAAQVT